MSLLVECPFDSSSGEEELSVNPRQRALEVANEADLRVTAPRATQATDSASEAIGRTAVTTRIAEDDRLPMRGMVLIRDYKGETLQVLVRDDGFEF